MYVVEPSADLVGAVVLLVLVRVRDVVHNLGDVGDGARVDEAGRATPRVASGGGGGPAASGAGGGACIMSSGRRGEEARLTRLRGIDDEHLLQGRPAVALAGATSGLGRGGHGRAGLGLRVGGLLLTAVVDYVHMLGPSKAACGFSAKVRSINTCGLS